MRGMFLRGVVVGSVTAALVLSASAALAGTGVGGIFNLGQSNTVNATSSLSGSTSTGAQLSVSNASTTTGARGLTVNSASSSAALLAHNSAGPAAAFQSPSSVSPFNVPETSNGPLIVPLSHRRSLRLSVSGSLPLLVTRIW